MKRLKCIIMLCIMSFALSCTNKTPQEAPASEQSKVVDPQALESLERRLMKEDNNNIFCLQKVNLSGNVTGTRYAFKQPNDNFMVFESDGTFLYLIDLTLWQRIGITYFKKYREDGLEYKTYRYQIDMDQYVYDYQHGRMLTDYPAVD